VARSRQRHENKPQCQCAEICRKNDKREYFNAADDTYSPTHLHFAIITAAISTLFAKNCSAEGHSVEDDFGRLKQLYLFAFAYVSSGDAKQHLSADNDGSPNSPSCFKKCCEETALACIAAGIMGGDKNARAPPTATRYVRFAK